MNAPFHAGELAAQALAGVTGSGNAIRNFMPDQHRTFFEALPFVLAATLDGDGRPRAQVFNGRPGFIASPDPHTLRIDAPNVLQAGDAIGLLGLDFSTRRRNRANGIVRHAQANELVVDVRESFGNCPQHITVRQVRQVMPQSHRSRRFEGLGERDVIAQADTFFIATTGGVHGVDISHRGGPPGFVGIEGDTLTIEDFNGNRYFNTFGNLLIDPRAALLFIDYSCGDVLELEGRADIIWEGTRRWRFTVARGTFQPGALPLRWRP